MQGALWVLVFGWGLGGRCGVDALGTRGALVEESSSSNGTRRTAQGFAVLNGAASAGKPVVVFWMESKLLRRHCSNSVCAVLRMPLPFVISKEPGPNPKPQCSRSSAPP